MSEPTQQPTENSDIEETAAADEDMRRWFVTLGHGLGVIGRSVVEGVDMLWKAVADDGGRGQRSRRTPAPPPQQPLSELLQELGDLVARHHEQGYESLAQSREFERLIYRIAASLRLTRRRERAAALQARRAARSTRPRELGAHAAGRDENAESGSALAEAATEAPAANGPQEAAAAESPEAAPADDEIAAPAEQQEQASPAEDEEDPLQGVLDEASGGASEDPTAEPAGSSKKK
jgi:hypothetical protein